MFTAGITYNVCIALVHFSYLFTRDCSDCSTDGTFHEKRNGYRYGTDRFGIASLSYAVLGVIQIGTYWQVFFHGGSYGWGAASDLLYDGHNLVERVDDSILVTVEYRTGIIGFVDFSSVEDGEEYEKGGNLGLLDQVEALRWIQKNIAAFGGDSDNAPLTKEEMESIVLTCMKDENNDETSDNILPEEIVKKLPCWVPVNRHTPFFTSQW